MGTFINIVLSILSIILLLFLGSVVYCLISWLIFPLTISPVISDIAKNTKKEIEELKELKLQAKRLADNMDELTRVLKEINKNSTGAS